jgi:hypothetical protein
MQRASLAILAVLAALPAAAQERGGVSLRNPVSELNAIDANRGCPLSATSVTVGLNKATGTGSSALQQLGTLGGSGMSGCRPLVSTQVVTGANLALGNGSSAGQSIAAKGHGGVLATTTFTRGVNIGFGAGSAANQRILNQTGR